MASTGMKRILAVAVDPDQAPLRVTAANLPTLRPIIQELVAQLAANHGYQLNVHYVVDHLRQMNETTLRQSTRGEIASAQAPDAIFTIGSRPTRAAFNARNSFTDPAKKNIPIVFAVVSNPEMPSYGPGGVRPLVDPRTMTGRQITGVSTSLVQTALPFYARIMRDFTDNTGRPLEPHYIFNENYVSSVRTADQLPPEVQHHKLPADDWKEILPIIGGLRKVTPQNARTCLLVMTSNVMFAHRWEVISSAHGRDIPTFFQQPECMQDKPGKTESAVAAYGLSAETIGREAAKMVSAVLNKASDASNIRVVPPQDFVYWVNRKVADDLGLTFKGKADRTYP